ncbi:unnamed protein product [Durusdinium trenchii]|uniref:Solute carrier family 40 protein n=1 Tax=Durusdinium trenchii TaxID=1381693 RepID=A0ABP0SGD8_9DINO
MCAWTGPGREVSSKAFMDELCSDVGGYRAFLRRLALQYFGWWVAIAGVPAVFLDHHRCESSMPYLAWCLYGGTVLAMLVMAVLMELTIVQRLGLLKAGELHVLQERRWRRPLASTVLWKLDSYTDMAFVFIARDCGSSLWWASLASIIFCTVFCQMLFNTCFACSDCDGELPESFGFVLLDFKAKPVTLKSSANLVGLEKVVGDVAQVCIQSLFLMSASAPHGFVIFSVIVGALNGCLSIALIAQDALQEESAVQDRELEQGTVLAALAGEVKLVEEGTSSEMPPVLRDPGGPSPERLGRSMNDDMAML